MERGPLMRVLNEMVDVNASVYARAEFQVEGEIPFDFIRHSTKAHASQ